MYSILKPRALFSRPNAIQSRVRNLFLVAGAPIEDLTKTISYPYPAYLVRVETGRAVTFLEPRELATIDAPEEAFVLFGPREGETPTALSSFRESGAFKSVLNNVLKQHATEEPLLIGMAKVIGKHRQGGHVHLFDQRNPPPPNRVGDPDDLIGLVQFDKKGNLESGTFEPVMEHRLYREIDGMAGLMTLPEHLHKVLVEELRKKIGIAK